MKIKLLLFFLMCFGILNAQGPFRNLIISEASLGAAPMAYVELTNKGDVTINLSEFEPGKVTPWTPRVGYVPGEPLPPIEDWYDVPEDARMMLPDVELAPGEQIKIPPDASLEVTHAIGNVKEGSELIADGDILRLTSDGMVVLSLTVQLTVTGIDGPSSGGIRVYPNPGDGTVNMDGLDIGSRIQVYNISGVPVLTRIVHNSNEVLSLESRPSGLYFIIVTDDREVVGRYRLIIR